MIRVVRETVGDRVYSSGEDAGCQNGVQSSADMSRVICNNSNSWTFGEIAPSPIMVSAVDSRFGGVV